MLRGDDDFFLFPLRKFHHVARGRSRRGSLRCAIVANAVRYLCSPFFLPSTKTGVRDHRHPQSTFFRQGENG